MLGIPCSPYGGEKDIIEGSPFAEWAVKHGVSSAIIAPSGETDSGGDGGDDGAAPRRSRNTWQCKCRPKPKRVLVPAGIENLNALCLDCGAMFSIAIQTLATSTPSTGE